MDAKELAQGAEIVSSPNYPFYCLWSLKEGKEECFVFCALLFLLEIVEFHLFGRVGCVGLALKDILAL